MKLTGAEIILRVLKEEGVDVLFGYPGGAVLNIYDALYLHGNEFTHITTAHEQGAAHAADAYARVTGKVGVVLATSGPGATNLVTGLAAAYHDSVPVVAITGNVSRDLAGLDSFQEVNICSIVKSITKWTTAVMDPDELAPTLRKAFRLARSGRPRPVLIDIPKDITALTADYEPAVPELPPVVMPADEAIAAAAELLKTASRPVVLAGGGVVRAGAEDALRAFAKAWQIPVGNTVMGAGLMDGEDLALGLVGMHGKVSATRAARNADLLIAVGTRFSDRVATDKTRFLARGAKVIHIDADPTEIGKNISATVKLTANVKETLVALARLAPNGVERGEWLGNVAAYREEDKVVKTENCRLHPVEMMDMICNLLPDGAIITTDVGQHQMWAAQHLKRVAANRFCTSGGLGAMGYGLGAAIGAQAAYPAAKVVHLTGDGSFHMNCNELVTAVSNGYPIVTVVFNNTALGMVRQWQKVFYNERYSCTSLNRKTDYVRLAEAYGGRGFVAETPEQFQAAFAQALQETSRPVVIDARICPDERVLPMIPPGKPLEDVILD